MRTFCEQYTRGAKVTNLRQQRKSRPGTLHLSLSKANLRRKNLQIVDVEATPLVEWLKGNNTVSKTAVERKVEEKRSVKNADAVKVQEEQVSDLLKTAHRTTANGYEFLVISQVTENDPGDWVARENCPSRLITEYCKLRRKNSDRLKR